MIANRPKASAGLPPFELLLPGRCLISDPKVYYSNCQEPEVNEALLSQASLIGVHLCIFDFRPLIKRTLASEQSFYEVFDPDPTHP